MGSFMSKIVAITGCFMSKIVAFWKKEEIEWPAKRVRDTFIEFFVRKNHVNWKSSPVVPNNDPTLLFVNAGELVCISIYKLV